MSCFLRDTDINPSRPEGTVQAAVTYYPDGQKKAAVRAGHWKAATRDREEVTISQTS